MMKDRPCASIGCENMVINPTVWSQKYCDFHRFEERPITSPEEAEYRRAIAAARNARTAMYDVSTRRRAARIEAKAAAAEARQIARSARSAAQTDKFNKLQRVLERSSL